VAFASTMEASKDEYWLSGDPSWRPMSEGKSPTDWVDSEIEPNEQWSSWQRQRLKPMASRFIYGPSWSIGLLVASTFPLIFPENTPDDQTVASVLFFSAFFVLLISATRIASMMPDGDGIQLLNWLWFGNGYSNITKTVGIPILGGLTFVAHIVIDARIGWISYGLFLALWYHLTFRVANSLMPSSGRWLIPLNTVFDDSKIDDSWQVVANGFRGGCLASKQLSEGRKLELHGVERGGEKFLALHFRHPSTLLFDPFVDASKIGKIENFGLGECGPLLEGISEELVKPPIALVGVSWPTRFNYPEEEE